MEASRKEARPRLHGVRGNGGIKVGRTRISHFIASLPTFHFTQYASTRPFCTNDLTELETHFFFIFYHSLNKYSLGLSNVPDTMLGAENIMEGAWGSPHTAFRLVREADKK